MSNNGLIKTYGLKKVIEQCHEEIQKVYLHDQRPWIVGYSGGKDSTAMLQLIFNAIKELPSEKHTKPIYVVSSNTLVENPLILNYLDNNIEAINKSAQKEDLPIQSHHVTPPYSESFWTLMIGKGYPSPRQKFRWCTSRLKINPIDNFIDKMTEQHEEVIVVLGVRREESQSRQQSIDAKTIEGKILKKHTSNPKAYVYAPIEHFDLQDIWSYLTLVPNPWNGDNQTLLSLYRGASDESECPIQQDADSPSCGQSRFGCWVCTVVVQDKSLTGFMNNGFEELGPLLAFRNWVYKIRDDANYRQKWRMNGAIYYLPTQDNKKKQGFGPFKLEARKEMLERLLKAEIAYNELVQQRAHSPFDSHEKKYYTLITPHELKLIREQWIKDGDWEDSLPKIYQKVKGESFDLNNLETPLLRHDELVLLEEVCEEHDLPSNVIKKLLLAEDQVHDLKIRKGILNQIDRILRQDWIHEDILNELMGEELEDETK